MAKQLPSLTPAQILTALMIPGKERALQVTGDGLAVPYRLEDIVDTYAAERVLLTEVANIVCAASTQARSATSIVIPAGLFQVGDLVKFRFRGKATALVATTNCTVWGELNAATPLTTPAGVQSAVIAATTTGLAVEFEALIKWTSATAWQTADNAGTIATQSSKVIGSAHTLDLALQVSGANQVTLSGIFQASLIRH